MGLKIKWLIFKKEKLNTQENDGLLIQWWYLRLRLSVCIWPGRYIGILLSILS